MDRLTSMAVFGKVVEASSFSAAARSLGISQATASKHVQMLEGWLGARLLNRTTRRVSLTEIGESFYAQCTRILEDIDEARATSKTDGALRGGLRVSAPISFGVTRLGAILNEFVSSNPAVMLDLFLSDRVVDPLEDGFDLAIRLGADEGAGLIVRRLAAFPSVLCASPAYLDGRERPTKPEDLESHVCLLDRLAFPGGWRFIGEAGVATPVLTYGFVANNALILRDVALSGGGILAAPDFVLQDDLATGRLIRLMTDWVAEPVELSIAFTASRQLSAKIRSLAAFLAERVPVA